MLPIVVFMIVVVVLAVGVLAFAAFHDRERALSPAPWLSEAMAKAADALPVVSTDERDGTERDGPGRDGTGRDGTGRDGTGVDGAERDTAGEPTTAGPRR